MNNHLASPLVHLGIPGLALLVAALFVLGARASAQAAVGGRAIAPSTRSAGARGATLRAAVYVGGLLGVTGAIAGAGLLSDLTRRPPLVAPMMLAVVAGTVFASRSALGRQIAENVPLWALVGAEAFRLPLEFVLRRAARDGVMPVQMSFDGYNFDVVTGTTALLLAVALYATRADAAGANPSTDTRRVPRAVVLAWNVLGSALLAVIVGIAITSMPFIAAFGPERVNDFVLHFPYVWLPTVLVPAALFGHLSVFRRLSRASRGSSPEKILGSRSPDSELPRARA